MALRTRLGVMYAKVESTYGTDPTPTGSANALLARDVELSPEIDSIERPDLFTSLSRIKEVGGKRRFKLSFMTEIRGSGTAGTAPMGLTALFKACGMSETISGGVSVTYAPRSSSFESCTIYLFMDGLQHQLQGCVGTFEISLVAGETGVIKWEFSGLYETPTDVSLPSTPTLDTTTPVALKNLTATFDSYAAVIRELTLKLNNKVAERSDLTAPHGIRGFDITDRNPEGELVMEAVLLATKNLYTKFEADTVQALSVAIGATAGNICTITASQCRTRSIGYGDDDGVLTHVIPFQLARSSGNDEISVVFT